MSKLIIGFFAMLLASMPHIAVADTGMDAGTDASTTSDASMADASTSDAGDAGPADVSTADVSPDASDAGMDAAAGDAAVMDGGDSDLGAPDGGVDENVRFAGRVTLQNANDFSGAEVEIVRQGTPTFTAEVTTDREGRFEFVEVPIGTYDVTISRADYETLETQVELARNVVREFRLFLDEAAEVTVSISFDGAPEAVDLSFESERGTLSETVSPSDGRAVFTGELGVGLWTFRAVTDSYRTAEYRVDVTDGGGPYIVSLQLTRDRQPEVFVDRGCGCGSAGLGTGSIAGLLLILVGAGLRRRRRWS